MKGQLSQYHLDFLEECKEVFEKNHKRETHISSDGCLIALRYGMDRDCIKIFDLGSERAFFHNIMEKCPVIVIRKEDM